MRIPVMEDTHDKLQQREEEIEALLDTPVTKPVPQFSLVSIAIHVGAFAVAAYLAYRITGWLLGSKTPAIAAAAAPSTAEARRYVQHLARNNEVSDTIANLYHQLQQQVPK